MPESANTAIIAHPQRRVNLALRVDLARMVRERLGWIIAIPPTDEVIVEGVRLRAVEREGLDGAHWWTALVVVSTCPDCGQDLESLDVHDRASLVARCARRPWHLCRRVDRGPVWTARLFAIGEMP